MNFLLVILLMLSSSSWAQSSNTQSANSQKTDDPKPKFSILDEFASPLDKPAKYVFFGGTAATLLMLSTSHEVIKPIQRDISGDRPLGKFSQFGDAMGRVIPNILYAGTFFVDWLINKDSLSGERSLLMTKATLYSSVVVTALKYTVREDRPNGGGSISSFPSGHSTTAFAFASVVGMEHDLPYGIAAYTLATFVGLSRLNDNAHWVHDVVAGATIGASYGVGLYYQAKKKRDWKIRNNKYNTETQSMFQILPTPNLDGALGVYTVSF